jgi:hypothetical protein
MKQVERACGQEFPHSIERECGKRFMNPGGCSRRQEFMNATLRYRARSRPPRRAYQSVGT